MKIDKNKIKNFANKKNSITFVVLKCSLQKWRNWQTRWTQNPVGFNTRAGSTPAFCTLFLCKPTVNKRLSKIKKNVSNTF